MYHTQDGLRWKCLADVRLDDALEIFELCEVATEDRFRSQKLLTAFGTRKDSDLRQFCSFE